MTSSASTSNGTALAAVPPSPAPEAGPAVWITRCPVPTASSIAFDRGLLTEDLGQIGCGVRSLQDSPDPLVRDAHFHHDLDSLIREGGNVPALWTRSRGADTRLVALTWVDEYQAILVADPAIDSPAALGGKRIGVPRHPGSVVDFWAAMALKGFDTALGLDGLGLDDVEIVDLYSDRNQTDWGPGARAPKGVWNLEIEALLAGEVDAVYVKGSPGVAAAKLDGIGELVEFGSHPDPAVRVNNGTPRTITVAASLLEQSDVVIRSLASLLRAADWAVANEAETLKVIAAETGSDAEEAKRAYGAGTAGLRPSLNRDWIDALDIERRFLASQDLLGEDAGFDIGEWLHPEPLVAALALVEADPAGPAAA